MTIIIMISVMLLFAVWRAPGLSRRARLAGGVLTLAAATGAGLWSQKDAPVDSGSPPSSAAGRSNAGDVAQRITTLENSLRALEAAEHSAPRDRWDPSYVVARLGRDPQVLHAWVRDHTAWIPYQGVLRGASGVLMDRQGNSLDRAILLATLLEAAGHRVRLANLSLPEEVALRGVVTRSGPANADAAVEAGRVPSGEIQKAATQYHLSAAAVAGTLEANDRAMSRLASELDARVADQTSRLMRAGVRGASPDDWQQRFQRAIDARRDHWWVQLESGTTWTDLEVDHPLTAAPAAGTPRQTVTLKDLPGAAPHHQIVVRIIAERWSRGAVTTRQEMEYALVPADLLGQPIAVQFVPEGALHDAVAAVGDPEFTTAENEERAWMAGLTVGSEVVAAATIENSVRGGGDFGGLGGAMSSMAGTDRQVLTAVWLEYDFKSPGDPARVIRRTVFDLIGPAARSSKVVPFVLDGTKRANRGLAMTMRSELLPVSCRLSRRYITHLVSSYALRNRRLLTVAARSFGAEPDAELVEAVDGAPPMVSPLYALALARLEWGANASRVFVDRPGLLTRHTYLARDGDQTVIRSATDIVANDVGVSLAVRDAFHLRLAHGVLDTNAEAFLHSYRSGGDNAADAFAVAHPWVALRPDQRSEVDALQLDADVRQRIRDDLAAGFAVVAPQSPVPIGARPFSGWWRIDPVTGHSLGMGANGWGQTAENAAITRRNTAASQTLKKAGIRFARVFVVVAGSCYVMHGVREIEKSGFVLGVKTVVARDSGQCLGEGVFWGSLVTLPLVALTVNLRFGAIAEVEGNVAAAGEGSAGSRAAGEGTSSTAAAGEGAAGEAAAGKGADGQSSGSGGSPRAGSVPPPAPRPLPEIEADIEAVDRQWNQESQKIDAMAEQYAREKQAARNRGENTPPMSDAHSDAVINKANAGIKRNFLETEYATAGGHFGPGGRPAGPRPAGGGWMEAGPHAGDLGVAPGTPPAGGTGSGVNPLANTVPVGGPQYAPARGGPVSTGSAPTVFAGYGGLFGIK